jgi:small-conductance mechanosensitive channel
MSHTNRAIRLEIKFGVSYESNPHDVKKIASQSVMELRRVLADPPPIAHIVAFGDSSIDYLLRFWIQDPESGMTNVRGDAFLALWDAFEKNGIKIPYPHREVILRTENTRAVGSFKLPDGVSSGD